MVAHEIKDIYESGVTILNVIKTLILLDILVVLVVALLNSRLFGIINSTLFWIAVILFFAYRAHFRARIKSLVRLEDWDSIKEKLSGPEINRVEGNGL